MSETPPPQPAPTGPPAGPPPSGGMYGFAERMFAMVDRPWKAVALAGLIAVGVVTAVGWEQRAIIAARILGSTVVPHLELKRFAAVAPQLATDVEADLIMLIEASVASNSMRSIAGWRKDQAA